MKLESKYNINQQVWLIAEEKEKRFIECTACSGKGNIKLDNDEFNLCPICYGHKGEIQYFTEKLIVKKSLTIGQIRVEAVNLSKTGDFDNYGEYKEGATNTKVQYMAYETGVGSGTIWPEERLFSDIDKAQSECDKLNEVVPSIKEEMK